MIEIFQPTVEYAPVISEIGASTFAETFVGLEYYTQEIVDGYTQDAFAVAKIAAEFSDPKITYFLLRAGDEFAGYAKLVEKTPPECVRSDRPLYLERIYLRKKFHGTGYGEKLLAAVTNIARKKGFHSLWLSVWEYNK